MYYTPTNLRTLHVVVKNTLNNKSGVTTNTTCFVHSLVGSFSMVSPAKAFFAIYFADVVKDAHSVSQKWQLVYIHDYNLS